MVYDYVGQLTPSANSPFFEVLHDITLITCNTSYETFEIENFSFLRHFVRTNHYRLILLSNRHVVQKYTGREVQLPENRRDRHAERE